MKLDVQRLRDLIASQPGIRTVQLSDKLDWDFDALEEVLNTEVRCARIIAYQVIGPNNRKATAYRMAGTPEPQSASAPAQVTAPTPVSAPASVQMQSQHFAAPPAPTRSAASTPTVKPAKTEDAQHPAVIAQHKGVPMASSTYTPRPGSKVALAVAALLDGPMNCQQLASAMGSKPNSVHAMLSVAQANNVVNVAKDESGLAHFYLVGMPIDERFKLQSHQQATKAVKKPTAASAPSVKIRQFRKAATIASQRIAAAPPQSRGEFVAGLLSNGELHIYDGIESITLTADHTNQLFTYLDKARAHHE